jgi:hypothetical protein
MCRNCRLNFTALFARVTAVCISACVYAVATNAAAANAVASEPPSMPAAGVIGLCTVAILCALAGVFILLRKS